MFTLIRQEAYKTYKNITIRWISILFVLYIIFKFFHTNVNNKNFALYTAGILPILSIIMIIITSIIISIEFKSGSIKLLLSRRYNRLQVFTSKIGIIILMYLFYQLISVLLIILAKIWLFPKISLSHVTNIISVLIIRESFFLLLVLSIMLPITIVIRKNPEISVAFGLILNIFGELFGIFWASTIKSHILIKFSPLNYLIIGSPIIKKASSIEHLTNLTIGQLYFGIIIYTVIFLWLTYHIFEKEDV